MKLTEAEMAVHTTSLRENPSRRKRWAPLMEGLADEMKGTVLASTDAVNQRRRIIESLLDQQLCAVNAGEGGNVALPAAQAAPKLHEGLMEFLDQRANALNEDTTIGWTATGSSTVPGTPVTDKIFTTQSLGIVRRVFPRLLAPDLLSVQTMSQPTGKVFYLDFLFNESNGTTLAAAERVDQKSAWDVADMRTYASKAAGSSTAGGANAEGATARELNLDVTSTSITAESKKLAAEWSAELQQDLRAYQGLDADEELQAATAAELTRETDRLLIDFLYTTTLSSGAGIVYWGKTPPSALPTEIRAYNETLYDAVEDAAEKIESVRYRKPTWLLMGTKVAARMRKLNGFRNIASNDDMDMEIGTGGRHLFGTIQERFRVYVDPWFIDDTIIVGYKGQNMMDAGIVYAPYIPFYRTPMFTNPLTMMNSRGIMTRFGKVSVVPEMYSMVSLTAS